MKKIITALALMLVLIMMMSISAVAFSSTVIDNPNYTYNSNGLKYVEKTTTENGSTEKIFYGEYNSTSASAEYEWVLHSIGGNDDGVATLSTVMNIAKNYENTTGRKVMMAVNGDFFFNTGEFVDSYAVNGEVVKIGAYAQKNSFGFDNEGTTAVGRLSAVNPMLKVYDAEGNSTLLEIDNFNSAPAEGEISVYTAAGTYNFSNVGVTQVKTDATNFTSYPVLGTEYTTTTKGVRSGDFSFTLRSGRYIIVYTAAHEDIFKTYSYGRELDIIGAPGGNFEGCDWVVGGYDILVNNGVANTNCHTDNSGNVKRARTFIGVKADGTMFVCVVDEIGGSAGITVNQEADLAKSLGAKYALELDGGGSSTMVVRINDTLTLRNKPSDGSMRSVGNAVLLVEKEKPHQCEHVCATCGKCTDTSCSESVCANKCQGHASAPVHSCESACDVCGKCKDLSCQETACANKCTSTHHTCEHACEICGKCKDINCNDAACTEKCTSTHHECEHACEICGKCKDINCNDAACTEKCTSTHHECEHVCEICGKCTDIACADEACVNKCQGHLPPHECENVCSECGKCTDATCADEACAMKCKGHEPPHECEHACDKCGKCFDGACHEEACVDKCQGHKTEKPSDTQTPAAPAPTPEEPKKTGFAAFIASIIEAIKNFFANLFK